MAEGRPQGEPAAGDSRPVATSLPVPAAEAPPAAPDEPTASQDVTTGITGPIVVTLAFVSAILTFLVLMGAFGAEPQGNVTVGLLGFNVLLILLLLFLVGRHLLALRRETAAGMTGARLQRRVVGLFSLVAAVPTALVAGAGLFALDRGLTPWFAGDLKRLVETSQSIAQNFQQQLCQNMGRELRLMASDLDRANTGGFYFGNNQGFQQFMNNRAEALGFPRAIVFKRDGSLLMQADVPHRAFSVPQPAEEDYQYAATDELPCLFTQNRSVASSH